MNALNPDSSAPLLGSVTKRLEAGLLGAAPIVAAPVIAAPFASEPTRPRQPVFIADDSAGADLLGISEALQPLAQLCVHADAQTPLMIALVGAAGSGKSFALARLSSAIGDLSAGPAKNSADSLLSKVAVIPLDAAQLSGDPASAIAAATYQALCHDYPALAAEAAHAGGDPTQTASLAAARHDEIQAKLDAERATRDEVDGKRARLSEVVLYQTPGSRIDAYARANRGTIESRLRRFDLLSGDAVANFKDLVRDFSGAGAGSRLSIALRALWGFRGQMRLLLWALVFFALAFGAAKLSGAVAGAAPRGLGPSVDVAADWLSVHRDWLTMLVSALIGLGALALLANLWRATTFSATLFRGLRLLKADLRERRHGLDASSARLNQRVAALSAQADAAAKHAEATAKRASNAARSPVVGPSPLFALAPMPTAIAARAFMAELGRLIGAPGAAPQRLVLTFDNFDALAPQQALDMLETAHGMIGASCVGAAAFNPATLALGFPEDRDALRERLERLFQIAFNVQGVESGEKARIVARLLAAGGADQRGETGAPAPTSIGEPLSAAETTLLTALSPLACSTPRRAKRFLNLYRLARTSRVSRPGVALMLAVMLSDDRRPLKEMERLLREPDSALGDPKGPPALFDAIQAARAAGGGRISNIDALLAMGVAQRYAPAL